MTDQKLWAVMGHVHTFSPPTTDKAIASVTCPDCGKRTRFVGFFQDWFGWRFTCLRCGRSYEDGEWLALDFVRGSRRKSIDAAKARWRATTHHKAVKK